MWITPEFNEAVMQNGNRPNRLIHQTNSTTVDLTKKDIKCHSNLWIEEAKPQFSTDLAVHKKKIQEVASWISNCTTGAKGSKFLLLIGPPGSGKSATFETLCRESNFEIREWCNPEKQDYSINDYCMNQTEQFTNFLNKSSKYSTLFQTKDKPKKNIILIQEFPPVFSKNPNDLHLALRKYNGKSSCPLVFIISDLNDNKNMTKQLLPPDLQEELSITNITFNVVANSILLTALNRVSKLKVQDGFLKESLSKQFLQSIVEKAGGDIRSAINTLQFSLSKDKSAEGKKKARSESEMGGIGCKDTKMLIFRALGKVLYCKRKPNKVEDYILPVHLKCEERLELEENPEEVFENSCTDASNFSLFLHQNCNSFFKDIHSMSKALDYVTDSNILLSHWNPDQSLESVSASICIRGFMHNLPRGSGGGSFRALTRPHFYKCRKLASERMSQAKPLCRMANCSDAELFCNLIPITSKIASSNHSYGDRLLREIGLMYAPPAIASSRHSGLNTTILNASLQKEDILKNEEDLQEDFLIEEFED